MGAGRNQPTSFCGHTATLARFKIEKGTKRMSQEQAIKYERQLAPQARSMTVGAYSSMTIGEIRLFLCMRRIPEEARVIGERAGVPAWEAMQRLEAMENRGRVFAYHVRGKPSLYHPIQHPRVPGA
jgi:hypothetical protein